MKNITRHTADRMSATKRIGKGKAMMKIYCDRCGEEITGIPLKMLPTACQNIPADALDELLLFKEPLRHKVFCKECIAEIADFALDKNACDECVQQMMDENAMLREPDPDEMDWDRALSGMEQYTMAERLKKIRMDCGLNQIEFSKILGVTNAHISRMEKGITIPSVSLTKLICKAFGINEEWLRSGEGGCLERRARMEDKKEIVMLLKHLLKATRAGADIRQMELGADGETVRITFNNQCARDINIACDSGIAIIVDVARALS